MVSNAVNLNFSTLLSSIGNLSTNKTETNQEESVFSSLLQNEGLEGLLEENGLNLDEIESPIELLSLILSLILGIDLNNDNEESKAQDTGLQATSSSRKAPRKTPRSSSKTSSAKKTTSIEKTEKTENTEKTSEEKSTDKVSSEKTDNVADKDGFLIREGKDHVYEVSSATAVKKFRDENPELFDENISSEDYNKAFDELAEKGEVVKHTLRSSANDKNNIKEVGTTEKTVIDMGDGIFLHKETVTFLDGHVLNGRNVNIGLDYTDIQYDENGKISKVTRGKEAKENGGSVSITSLASNYSGDSSSFLKAYNECDGGQPRDYSDKYIKALIRRGYN